MNIKKLLRFCKQFLRKNFNGIFFDTYPKLSKIKQYEKMVFIGGPRQVGKTTLAIQIAKHYKDYQYLNWDNQDDRSIIIKTMWKYSSELIIKEPSINVVKNNIAILSADLFLSALI